MLVVREAFFHAFLPNKKVKYQTMIWVGSITGCSLLRITSKWRSRIAWLDCPPRLCLSFRFGYSFETAASKTPKLSMIPSRQTAMISIMTVVALDRLQQSQLIFCFALCFRACDVFSLTVVTNVCLAYFLADHSVLF